MTPEEFNRWQSLLGPTRRAFCEKLGIAKRTGDAYGLGRSPVPFTVRLAIAALDAGLQPADSPEKKSVRPDGL